MTCVTKLTHSSHFKNDHNHPHHLIFTDMHIVILSESLESCAQVHRWDEWTRTTAKKKKYVICIVNCVNLNRIAWQHRSKYLAHSSWPILHSWKRQQMYTHKTWWQHIERMAWMDHIVACRKWSSNRRVYSAHFLFIDKFCHFRPCYFVVVVESIQDWHISYR